MAEFSFNDPKFADIIKKIRESEKHKFDEDKLKDVGSPIEGQTIQAFANNKDKDKYPDLTPQQIAQLGSMYDEAERFFVQENKYVITKFPVNFNIRYNAPGEDNFIIMKVNIKEDSTIWLDGKFSALLATSNCYLPIANNLVLYLTENKDSSLKVQVLTTKDTLNYKIYNSWDQIQNIICYTTQDDQYKTIPLLPSEDGSSDYLFGHVKISHALGMFEAIFPPNYWPIDTDDPFEDFEDDVEDTTEE